RRSTVASCEVARAETFRANALLPQSSARVCRATNTPLGHVSSGCIYSGAKVFENGAMRVERDLNRPEVRRLFEAGQLFGFTEQDEPNFSFRNPPCSFHSGTKALAEESVRDGQAYVGRLGLQFNERDEPGNL